VVSHLPSLRTGAFLLLLFTASAVHAQWAQFGGPRRDFTLPPGELPDHWPTATGPKILWKRSLGDGYSGVIVQDGVAYTMYEKKDQDSVIALDAKTGKTLWEHPLSRATTQHTDFSQGPGPHATPLLVNGRLFVVNTVGRCAALDPKTGALIWEIDLWQKYGGILDRGYGASPLAWKDLIILPIGGAGQAVMAFRQKDGSLAWKGGNSKKTFSSPMLIEIAKDVTQLVVFCGDEVAAFNPDNGDPQWSFPHKTDYDLNISLPTFGSDGIMVLSSAYSGGSRGLQLTWTGSKTEVKELWAHKKLRLHHNDALRIGDVVYASSGDFGPAPLTAVNVKDGKTLWQDRGLGKCGIIGSGDRVMLLSEDGELALADLSPTGMKILARAQIGGSRAWTAPAIVGGVAYIRDRSDIQAVQFK
jgi:outer membrane protein assembly factor BamB